MKFVATRRLELGRHGTVEAGDTLPDGWGKLALQCEASRLGLSSWADLARVELGGVGVHVKPPFAGEPQRTPAPRATRKAWPGADTRSAGRRGVRAAR